MTSGWASSCIKDLSHFLLLFRWDSWQRQSEYFKVMTPSLAPGGGECASNQEGGREETVLKRGKGRMRRKKTNERKRPPWTGVQTVPCWGVPGPGDEHGRTLGSLCSQATLSGWSWGPRRRLRAYKGAMRTEAGLLEESTIAPWWWHLLGVSRI